MNTLLKTVLILSFIFPAQAQEWVVHSVQPQESLTIILTNYKLYPIYGSQGSLRLVLQKNAFLLARPQNENLIFPGEQIILPIRPQRAIATIPPEEAIRTEKKVEEKSESKKFFPQSALKAEGSLRYFEIYGKDESGSSGRLNSSFSPGVGLTLSTFPTDQLDVNFGFTYQALNFEGNESRQIKGGRQNIGKIFVELAHDFAGDAVKAELQAGRGDIILYRALDATTLEIDKVPNFYVQPGLRMNLWEKNNLSYSLFGAYRFLSAFDSGVYHASQGSGFLFSLSSQIAFQSSKASVQFFHSEDRQNVSPINFKRSETGIAFNLIYELGN